MIILDTKEFYQDSRLTLNMFKKLLYNNYNTLKQNDPEIILVLTRIFSEDDIDRAIKDISLDKHRNIVIDNHIRSNVILRYLEYGGEALRAPNLLSKAKKDLERRSLNVQ